MGHRIGVKIVAVTGVGALVLLLAGHAYAFRSAGGGAARFSGAARFPSRLSPRPRIPHRMQRSPHRRHQFNAHQPGQRSRPPQQFRRTFRAPSAGHRAFTLRDGRYISYGGRYYLNTRSGLQPVTAPIGTTRNVLPVGHVKVDVRSQSYFYHHGTFYRHNPEPQQYVVVAAPVGAKVPVIPPGYTTVYIDSFKYYKLGDVYYRSSYRSGDLEFEVVDVD